MASGAFTGLGNLQGLYALVHRRRNITLILVMHRDFNVNLITSLVSGVFSGLDNLSILLGV